MVKKIFLILFLDDLNTLDVLVPLDTVWEFEVTLESHRNINLIHLLILLWKSLEEDES